MSTPIDRAVERSRNLFLGAAGLVVLSSLWTLWNGEIFPAAPDPTGDPENWTKEECRIWLQKRNLSPESSSSREFLLDRVKVNMKKEKAKTSS